MEYRFRVTPKKGYLHIWVDGDNTPETVMRYLQDVFDACTKHGTGRVLIEENLEGTGLDLGEIFGIASGNQQYRSAIETVAYVDVNPAHDAKNMQFAETVAVNRGANIRMFRNVDDAEIWIQAEAQNNPSR